MNVAFALAREEMIRALTAYSGIATADGASGATSLIDSALIGKNDFLTGKSILIMSGDAQYETTGISAFDDTTGEITFASALSAQIVAGVSFRVLNVLPESVHISSGQVQLQGYDYESGEWRSIRVTGSGEIAIAITIADIVTAKISGEVVKISGETVSIEVPTMIKTGPVRTLSDASGGVALHSGAVKAAIVKALTDNSGVIMVGGSGDRPWYEAAGSAQGMVLAAGEAQSKDISNFDQVYVVAQVSGDKVAFDGIY